MFASNRNDMTIEIEGVEYRVQYKLTFDAGNWYNAPEKHLDIIWCDPEPSFEHRELIEEFILTNP